MKPLGLWLYILINAEENKRRGREGEGERGERALKRASIQRERGGGERVRAQHIRNRFQ